MQPVPQRHHVALALVEDPLHGRPDLLAKERVLHVGELALGIGLLDQVAQLGLLADRRLERQGLAPAHLHQVVDLRHVGVELLGQLLARRLAPVGLGELEPRPVELAQPVVDVHGQADGPRAVRDGPRDALADPPRGVGGELEAPAPVEQLDRAHQPDVPLLDQVEQGKPLSLVLTSDRNDQTKVRHDEALAGGLGLADVGARLRDGLLRAKAAGAESLLGVVPALDGHGKLDLLLLGEERLPSRRLEVEPEVVGVVRAQWASRFSHLRCPFPSHRCLFGPTTGEAFRFPLSRGARRAY